jgi:signal transduction histidine kinase/CheY-like chemotaxis protein
VSIRLLTLDLTHEQDVVLARQRARQLAGILGFEAQDQTRIATALSEIARNAFNYGGGGKVEFHIEGRTAPQIFLVTVRDRGPGIRDLKSILEGRYQSSTGMGIGILGARRLMDQFQIESRPGSGTTVVLKKFLPRSVAPVTPAGAARVAERLARERQRSPIEEIQAQNQELVHALDELRKRQEDLLRLNRELEDTNRGVVALYAELDERADHLRRADDLKTRFLSNMSHEFRTPVNSILALSRILLDRIDGPLNDEQEKQVTFIRRGAEALQELINDLLDLAKVEAGKIEVQPIEFEARNLFGALRGMLRPLLLNNRVNLVFDEPDDLPALYTDEAKLSQILRNFISNALKFTESGEVRVTAGMLAGQERVCFAVADTGIGIAPENQEAIFQEFTQVANPLQKTVKGTGLGLPLSRKLAELLGGCVRVESEVGKGSTFFVEVPLRLAPPAEAVFREEAQSLDSRLTPILVVEDAADAFLVYEKMLKGSRFQPLRARSLREAREGMIAVTPAALILDIQLRGEDSWNFLAELKRDDATRQLPVLVLTNIEDPAKALALGADEFAIKPVERIWLLDRLGALTGLAAGKKVLIIDDDEMSRYLIRDLLDESSYAVLEAASGSEGLLLARRMQPSVILLDLEMPGMSGLEVLAALEADSLTRGIPVVIITAHVLPDEERKELSRRIQAILPKSAASRAEAMTMVREALSRAGVTSSRDRQ